MKSNKQSRIETEIEIAKENETEFISRWNKKCEEIKKQKLSKDQCAILFKDFSEEIINQIFELHLDEPAVQELNTDVNLALEVAFSNYRREKKKNSILARMFNFKNLNLGKK
jgi:hypothetical protein